MGISQQGQHHIELSATNIGRSEREVTGLVFALAGYLTYEVYEEIPFILLDSLEAPIDPAWTADIL